MDLQNVNLKKTIDAGQIDIKLKGLNWVTSNYSKNAELEIKFLRLIFFSIRKIKY